MKKHVVWIILLIVLLILLVPIPQQYNDGGTTAYKAVLYSVYDVHKIYEPNEAGKMEYIEGIIIEILGKEVYNNTEPYIDLKKFK